MEDNKESLFREKSMERLSSPEQLNDYIRVANPGVWLILGGIIALLLGVCAWGIFGKLDTTVTGAAVCQDGKIMCYISEADGESVRTGMTIKIGDVTTTVKAISSEPSRLPDDTDQYLMHLGGLDQGSWVYTASADADIDDGSYAASIVTESVSPMSFVFN